ncbi:MAG TPA: hypothetical protein VMR41_00350 [Patescibacteria group bacterium]|nr:hypothetical protein [Patescibacteria group bacterium]
MKEFEKQVKKLEASAEKRTQLGLALMSFMTDELVHNSQVPVNFIDASVTVMRNIMGEGDKSFEFDAWLDVAQRLYGVSFDNADDAQYAVIYGMFVSQVKQAEAELDEGKKDEMLKQAGKLCTQLFSQQLSYHNEYEPTRLELFKRKLHISSQQRPNKILTIKEQVEEAVLKPQVRSRITLLAQANKPY